MTGLNSDALNRMRAQFQQLLPDTCTIEQLTPVSDGAGGWSESWQAVPGGTVACRLDPLLSREQLEVAAGQPHEISEYLLTVPFDAPLAPAHRVVVNGQAYQVRHLMADHSWRVARRAYVTRLE